MISALSKRYSCGNNFFVGLQDEKTIDTRII
jgi:hypothetical protein